MESKQKTRKSLAYYMRAVHRVLGYLTLGLVMVYAISGITLIYRTGDFLKKSTHVTETIKPDLNADQLAGALKLRNMKVSEETETTITFADGSYDKATGVAEYTRKEFVAPINKFIDLHKLPSSKRPAIAWITTIFGACLFLLALTSLFMFKTASKQFKWNMLYTAIGVVLAAVLTILM